MVIILKLVLLIMLLIYNYMISFFYNYGIKVNEYMVIILLLQRVPMIPYCNC